MSSFIIMQNKMSHTQYSVLCSLSLSSLELSRNFPACSTVWKTFSTPKWRSSSYASKLSASAAACTSEPSSSAAVGFSCCS